MSDRGHHCPFINRADARCSHNFTLDRPDQAFDRCFSSYHACPVFVELLTERRIRRGETLPLAARNVAHAAAANNGELVQVQVSAGYSKRTA